MRSSHHFMIGNSHTVCEDYAYSNGDFAALSDGCSIVRGADGKKREAHTDVGARLLVRAAFRHSGILNHGLDVASSVIIHTADSYRQSIGLSVDSLSATLLTLSVEGDWLRGVLFGDGVIAGRVRESGQWSFTVAEYCGPPHYLKHQLTGFDLPGSEFRIENFGPPLESGYIVRSTTPNAVVLDSTHFDIIVGMSDGAFSFTKDNQPVPFYQKFAERLLGFRRMGGQFVQRHLRGTLKDLAKEGIVNQDDISMVAIYRD